MTQRAMPFDGTDYYEADWRDVLWAGVLRDGVRKGEDNELEAFGDGSGLNVKVKSGKATVRRMTFHNDAQVTLSVGANISGSTRIDRVIIRFNMVNNTGVLAILAGTPGAGAPALTQTSTVWEVSLAQVSIPNNDTTIDAGQVTDERAFVSAQEPLACTSTTRPASPFTGQVIFETDTRRNLTWNGSAWVNTSIAISASGSRPASPYEGLLQYETNYDQLVAYDGATWRPVSGMKLLSSIVPSGSVSVVTFSGIDYVRTGLRGVMVVVSALKGAVAATNLLLRWNGATTDYYRSSFGLGSDGVAANESGTNQADVPVGSMGGADAGASLRGVIEFPEAVKSTIDRIGCTFRSETSAGTGNGAFRVGGASNLATGQAPVDSIELRTASGANFLNTSTFHLYGIFS